jgi:hypothetical protein
MIKLIKAETIGASVIRLTFSDGKQGDYDFFPILKMKTVLTRPLETFDFFKSHFIELGALCWPNGLEFSPAALYRELQDAHQLIDLQEAA